AEKAFGWFGGDAFYPGGWEPSGQDFLSPALTEAELMAQILPQGEFAEWLSYFLPRIAAGGAAPPFTPGFVSAPPPPPLARAPRRRGPMATGAGAGRGPPVAAPARPPGSAPAKPGAGPHADAALPHVLGDDYMVEHWLACYAVLLLS